METIKILHLDDEIFELERMSQIVSESKGAYPFQIWSALDRTDFEKRFLAVHPDLVILDIHIDQALKGGVSLAQWIRTHNPSCCIFMCSAFDDAATISECLNFGADDFISKNSDKREIAKRLYESFQLAKEKRGILSSVSAPLKPRFVGHTFEKIAKRIPNILQSAISAVHVQGESGTGKEMVADLFFEFLGDKSPFVRVNCGAIAPTLLESELFGHVKGAFTGAQADKQGLIESANGGWIFLDEVSSLSPSAQVALLRVIENQEVLRVGATRAVQISIKILSATNEPLPELVAKGKFRKDLWQRLCEAEIYLPPLRERKDEILSLIDFFCKVMPGGPYRITEPALEVLGNFSWKSGNIRELRNCLRAMTELHLNKLLTPLSIPERIWKQMEESDSSSVESTPFTTWNKESLCGTMASSLTEEIAVHFDPTKPIQFDELSDKLLLELTRKIAEKNGRLSLRQLAKTINVSRSTLSTRFRGLVDKKLVPFEELTQLVGLIQR